MGSAFSGTPAFDSKGSNIRHKTGIIHTVGKPFPVITDRSAQEAKHKTYFVCQTFGKSDGFRMTRCAKQQLTLADGMAWIDKENAAADLHPHSWEHPRIFSLVGTDDEDFLARFVGSKPVFDDF
jgi:hypothetical protein